MKTIALHKIGGPEDGRLTDQMDDTPYWRAVLGARVAAGEGVLVELPDGPVPNPDMQPIRMVGGVPVVQVRRDPLATLEARLKAVEDRAAGADRPRP